VEPGQGEVVVSAVAAAASAAVAVPAALVLMLGAGFSSTDEPSALPSSGRPIAVSAPAPYRGGSTGCVLPDPTGTGGCVTGATAWLLTQVRVHVHTGPVSCWDAHAWNPTSDHPRGRACDYTIGRAGQLPSPGQTTEGWRLATWLRTHADELNVAYVIWQGHIWSARRAAEGWRPYSGGGIYNPADITGGHYDHVHVSLTG
jgi:hypothetical protein